VRGRVADIQKQGRGVDLINIDNFGEKTGSTSVEDRQYRG